MGGGGTNTVTQQSGPWAGATSFIQDAMQGARNQYRAEPQGPSYYPSNTYTPMNAEQGAALNNIYNFGTNATGYSASSTADDTLNNEMNASLNPSQNPDLQAAVSSTLASVMPSLQGSFAAGGRADSGSAASAAASGATSAIGNLEFGQYNTNVANQQKAAALAPQTDAGVMSNLEGAFNAQTGFQEDQQNQLNANINRYDYQQMQPYNALGLYEQGLNGSGFSGGSATTTSPYGSQLGNILGTATGGLGVANGLGDLFAGSSGGGLGALGSWIGSMLAFAP